MNPVIEKKLNELLDFAKKNNLAEVVWQEKGMRIAFRRDPVAAAPAEKEAAESVEKVEIPYDIIRSPIVGTFRRSVSKTRPPAIMKGNRIKPGDRLGVVESMKLPTEVVSFCKGQVDEILVEDGQSVEYNQPLFSVRQEAPSTNGKR